MTKRRNRRRLFRKRIGRYSVRRNPVTRPSDIRRLERLGRPVVTVRETCSVSLLDQRARTNGVYNLTGIRARTQ